MGEELSTFAAFEPRLRPPARAVPRISSAPSTSSLPTPPSRATHCSPTSASPSMITPTSTISRRSICPTITSSQSGTACRRQLLRGGASFGARMPWCSSASFGG
ncbi:hypothetical protein TorRG33x02_032190 [Trema orientale]|uniref:Uncharacterized protein n=1 Tax=Trema orientale TaxID=63057 RepID=A0A2P5FTC3_TREOI|nr:hypothetical protein TorRG33x02_032190 [Trema orientale]